MQGPTIHSPRVPGAIHYFGSSTITPEAVSLPALLRLLTASIDSVAIVATKSRARRPPLNAVRVPRDITETLLQSRIRLRYEVLAEGDLFSTIQVEIDND